MSVTFMGHRLTDKGLEPDLSKGSAITKMPRPEDKAGVKRPTILDKTVEKIAYLGGIFSKLRSRPILPSPLPLEAVLLGLQKKAGSLSICRKQL